MAVAEETYPRYYHLWHLVAIGALRVRDAGGPEACPVVEATIWDALPTPAAGNPDIALIDMGVARFHPNLDGPSAADDRILWDKAADFASHPFGARTVALPPGDRHLEAAETFLEPGDLLHYSTALQDALGQINAVRGTGVRRYVTAYDRHYATHGTACAGLTSGTTFGSALQPDGRTIAYYGVDPFSRLVPITTSISPDPLQLIRAFLYARKMNPAVILFPRSAHELDTDGAGEADETDEDGPATGAANGAADRWNTLGQLILEISRQIPIVCASGNDGRSRPIYPASLAAEPGNGVIAVGAVSYRGYRSGYSNYGAGLTCVAPSDDGEVYTRHQVRLDRLAADAADFFVPAAPVEVPFSAERLVTLDVPGPRGYREGTRRGPVRSREAAADDPSGLYAAFGGTSGAAAIVAGVVSLMQRQAGRMSGPEIKDRLEMTRPTNFDIGHWYWTQSNTLRPDAMNGEPHPSEAVVFGEGGLVNVQTLLNITL